jgi:hypothetical protein
VTARTFSQAQSKGGRVKKTRQPKPAKLSREPSSQHRMGKSGGGEYPGNMALAHKGPNVPKVRSTRPKIGGKTPKDHGVALHSERAAKIKQSKGGKPPSKTVLEQRSRNPRRKSD